MTADEPRTFVEKVIARHCSHPFVSPGQIVGARIDLLSSDGFSFPQIVSEFTALAAPDVFDPRRVVVVADHDAPARDLAAAQGMKLTREFLALRSMRPLVEGRSAGIAHLIVPDSGLIGPGEVLVGCDSHVLTAGAIAALAIGIGATDAAVALAFGEVWLRVPESVRITLSGTRRGWTTPKDVALGLTGTLGQDGCLYEAIEFDGTYVRGLGMDGRFTLTNMAIEVGAKSAAVAFDETTASYLAGRLDRAFEPVWSDPGAHFGHELELDVHEIGPSVALPGGPDRVVPISEAAGNHVDQVFIGSCANGRLSDLRIAAEVMTGRRVHEGTRLVVVPGSAAVFRAALAAGLIARLADAGAVIGPAGCGPCAGLHMGVLADGEVAIATSSRNFPGRMGSGTSQVYLASPAVAAASAVAGEVADPLEVAGPPQGDLESSLSGI